MSEYGLQQAYAANHTYHISIPDDENIKYKQFRYPAGEVQVRLLPEEIADVKAATKIYVTARIQDGEIMTLAGLTSALSSVAAPLVQKTLTLPYLPYGRADRSFTDGDANGLWTFGVFINALGYDNVTTFDVHNEEKAKYAIDNLTNFSAEEAIKKTIEDIGGDKNDLCIVLPDKGASRYAEIVDKLGISVRWGGKKRDPESGKLIGFKAPFVSTLHKRILIVDDICDGGGTFNGLAAELEVANARKFDSVFLYVSHGIFSQGYYALASHFDKIYTTDSFRPKARDRELVKVITEVF